MMIDSFLALEAFLTRYVNLYSEESKSLPFVEFETAWPSDCVVEIGSKPGAYYWKPLKRDIHKTFTDIENALEFSFHEDIKVFFGSFWSNGICVEREDINFSLIQTWNDEDEKQLTENMLGHVFAKLKAKLPVTYFIGCTYGDEIVCLDHNSGQIVLEKPGRPSHKVLSNNLESFLISLQPTMDKYTI
tara:strand:+ start:14289 stop:14852 length:564 start_codon:yes stop_codon:yes gene_type:complete